ncbi:dUTPase [Gemella morbillorum]
MRGFELIRGYDGKLPARGTPYSACVDFYACEDVILRPGTISNIISTGVKAYMKEDEGLMLYARSSMAKKHGLRMSNSVGVIDADFYNNIDNEGHITFLYDNITDKEVKIAKHSRIGQGMFTKLLPINNVEILSSERVGGYGSTGNK